MTELLGIISLVTGLDHDGLSARESAREHNNNLSVLDAVKERKVGQMISTGANQAIKIKSNKATEETHIPIVDY